jgi:two-component system, response regulator PdtaR
VLIVEDELLIALDLQDAVEAAHARVVGPAATVREALDLLRHEPVNAAILDVNLPRREPTVVAPLLNPGAAF